jgi:hypothetical protein
MFRYIFICTKGYWSFSLKLFHICKYLAIFFSVSGKKDQYSSKYFTINFPLLFIFHAHLIHFYYEIPCNSFIAFTVADLVFLSDNKLFFLSSFLDNFRYFTKGFLWNIYEIVGFHLKFFPQNS